MTIKLHQSYKTIRGSATFKPGWSQDHLDLGNFYICPSFEQRLWPPWNSSSPSCSPPPPSSFYISSANLLSFSNSWVVCPLQLYCLVLCNIIFSFVSLHMTSALLVQIVFEKEAELQLFILTLSLLPPRYHLLFFSFLFFSFFNTAYVFFSSFLSLLNTF